MCFNSTILYVLLELRPIIIIITHSRDFTPREVCTGLKSFPVCDESHVWTYLYAEKWRVCTPPQAHLSRTLWWHVGQPCAWHWLYMNSCHILILGPDVTCLRVVGLGNSVPSLFHALSNLKITTPVQMSYKVH